jgi:hypothetical protein
VQLTDPHTPSTARVDYHLARTLRAALTSQQDENAQSTGTSHRQESPGGLARTGSHHHRWGPLLSKLTAARPTP